MSYYSGPEALAANPAETWRVVHLGKGHNRKWMLRIVEQDYQPYLTFKTEGEALAERDNPESNTRRAVEVERLWYQGVTPIGWKPWEERKAERMAA